MIVVNHSSEILITLKTISCLHFQSIEDGLIGESPYIGKGRFRQQMLSRQRGQGDAELQEMQKEHEALDRELEEKKMSIERGKLKNLPI